MGENSVVDHYESLLAEHYTWMMGGLAPQVERNKILFEKLGLTPGSNARAVDMGAGSGFQSLPLAEIGYTVAAIDLSPTLIEELKGNIGELPITPIVGDIVNTPELCPDEVELVVCMGDTLPHLPSRSVVRSVLTAAEQVLAPGGRLVLGFRDLSFELRGLDRFIPIRADDTRIFTCCLEYAGEKVRVNDLVYIKDDTGWTLHKSRYEKLRLEPARVAEWLRMMGMHIAHTDSTQGMATILAEKPE